MKSLKYTPGGTEAGLAYTASVGPEMEDLACLLIRHGTGRDGVIATTRAVFIAVAMET